MKQLYIVTAIVDGNGAVLQEAFENENEALDFSDTKNVKQILRETYNDAMADHPSLMIVYSPRKLHTGKFNPENLFNE